MLTVLTRSGRVVLVEGWIPPKHERACCLAKRDELGRLPIGFCGPDCEGRELTEQRRAVVESGYIGVGAWW